MLAQGDSTLDLSWTSSPSQEHSWLPTMQRPLRACGSAVETHHVAGGSDNEGAGCTGSKWANIEIEGE